MQGQQGLIGGLFNAGGTLSAARGGEVKGYDDGGDVNQPDVDMPSFSGSGGEKSLGAQGGGGSAKSAIPMLIALMADGGEVKMPMAYGGDPTMGVGQAPAPNTGIAVGPQSSFGQFLNNQSNTVSAPQVASVNFGNDSGAAALQKGSASAAKSIGKSFSDDDDAAIGAGARGGSIDFRSGGKVNAKKPGEKAVKKGKFLCE